MSRKKTTKRKQRPQTKPKRDYASFFGGLFVAFVVFAAIGERALRFVPNEIFAPKTQHAQLVDVPEIIEEIDAPEPQPLPDEQSGVAEEETGTNFPSGMGNEEILREVQIEGPVDSIVGDPVYLRVRADGSVRNYAWTISPEVDGLFVLDDGSNAIFTNRNAQKYTVYVSAVDDSGNIEQDTFTFELIQQKESLTLKNLSEANPDPTIPELIDYYIAEVRSPNKESESQIVSQSFRQTANLLRTGAITPGSNILGEMQKGIELSMGPKAFANWQIYFERLQTLLAGYAAKGHLSSRDAWVNTLENLAAVMESRSERKLSLQ